MTKKTTTVRPQGVDYEIRVIGAEETPFRDFYHAMLRYPWPVTFLIIAGVFLAANAVFALAYLQVGGVAHATPGSYPDAFFFSVQTMATIGYGAMYPESQAANVLVIAESVVGLTLTALATGLVFARFSRPTARILFSRHATISPVNGVPTLAFRIGNRRSNEIIDAQIRVSMVRTEVTLEGKTFYRLIDLQLTRARAQTLSRSLSIFHTIDVQSPLFETTPDALERQEVELQVLVLGTDDTSMQPVHASYRYHFRDLVWGARHRDVLSESEDGALVLDLRWFHTLEATPATEAFPHTYAPVEEG